jgi:hypothetical protein
MTRRYAPTLLTSVISKEDKDGAWHDIVDDAKGVETPEFKLKKKLMKACLGIEIFTFQKKCLTAPHAIWL